MTLLVKATVLLASATAPANSAYTLVFSVALASVVLTFWGQVVYQNKAVSLLHTSFFTNLAILNITKLFLFDDVVKISIASFALISIPLVLLAGIVCSKFYKMLPQKVVRCFRCRTRVDADDIEHELVNFRKGNERDHEGDSSSCSSIESVGTY